MAGTSQGSAYPEYSPTHSISPTFGVSHIGTQSTVPQSTEVDEWQATVDNALSRIARLESATRQLNESTDQRGRSWSLPVEPTEQARVPVWTSRREWLRQFRHHTTSPAGRALCARNLIKPDKAYAVAQAHAHFAESHTGRGVSAAKSTIAARAKVSESSVNRRTGECSSLWEWASNTSGDGTSKPWNFWLLKPITGVNSTAQHRHGHCHPLEQSWQRHLSANSPRRDRLAPLKEQPATELATL